jgi:hypothetical protein
VHTSPQPLADRYDLKFSLVIIEAVSQRFSCCWRRLHFMNLFVRSLSRQISSVAQSVTAMHPSVQS